MAYRYLKNIVKTFGYYLLLFALCRILFFSYFYDEVTQGGKYELLQSLYHALPLDISTACYLLFLPSLVFLFASFRWHKFFLQAVKIFVFITSFFIVVFSIAEIGIYQEVHVKLYFNMLTHLKHIDELLKAVSYPLLTVILGLIFLIGTGTVLVLNKIFPKPVAERPTFLQGTQLILIFAVVITLCVIGCRGGLQPIPINEGEVLYSSNQCLNDATINPLWNLAHSYIENKRVLSGGAYHFMPNEEAEKIVNALYAENTDSITSAFKTTRPNICFLILESWSADVVESCGGYSGIASNFENLSKEGYLFTRAFPSGHLSDQGIPAILSGYPALPIGSSINQPGKYPNLPCLNKQLQRQGYYSSFFFGGQLIYGNIKSYIYFNQFNRVTEQKDLPENLPAGRLGIRDSIMLSLWLDSINNYRQPFFSCLFTLSTHTPFDAGCDEKIDWGGTEKNYLNSVVYSDRQIGKFFEAAKKHPWYTNTIFVLVADHSHNTPKNYDYDTPEFYHIPLLICGGALKDDLRGIKDSRVVSQTDIASTILAQTKMSYHDYKWGKNLFNQRANEFAFYTFNEGFGFAEHDNYVVWNKNFPSMNKQTGTAHQQDSLQLKGRAMLQVLMKDFLER
jgi:phosphoglycerol transferase MdoB-like AlkP superfamily enzyme